MRFALVLALAPVITAGGCTGTEEPREATGRAEALHACSSVSDPCDDGDICTMDVCEVALGSCRHQRITGCCTSAAECDDGNVCTTDGCDTTTNACTFMAILGCVPDASVTDGAPPDVGVLDGSAPDVGIPDAAADATAPDGGLLDGGDAAPADGGDPPRDGGAPDGDAGDAAGDGGDARADGGNLDGGVDAPPVGLDVRGGACAISPGVVDPAPALGWLLALLVLLRRRRRAGRRAGVSATMIAVVVLGYASSAQAQRFRLDRLHAPSLPEDLFWLERPNARPAHDGPFARLTLAYADDPLIVGGNPASGAGAIVSEQLGVTTSVGYTAWRRAHLSLTVPFWVQGGDGVALPPDGEPYAPGSPALGAPGASLRVRLLEDDAPVELALALSATLPVGDVDALSADDGPTAVPRVLFAVPLGFHDSFVGMSLAVAFRPETRLGLLRIGHELRWVMGGCVGITDTVAVALELAGSTVLAQAFDGRHTPLEATGSMRYRHPVGVTLGLGLGAGLSPGYGAPDARVLATVGYRWIDGA